MSDTDYAQSQTINNSAEKTVYWRTPAKLLISAAAFGVLFSVLFTKQGLGLNVTAAVLMAYAFAIINRKQYISVPFRQERLICLLALPVICLGILFIVSDTALRYLGLPVMLLVLLVQYIVLSGNALRSWDKPGFLIDIICGGVNRILLGIHCFIVGALETLFKRKKASGAMIGLVLGIGLLVIIVPVLISADTNMADIIETFFEDIVFSDIFIYGFLFLLSASAIAAPIATAQYPEIAGPRTAAIKPHKTPIQIITTAIALTMLGSVYVLFASLQFPYFFAPKETLVTVLGLTSSAYAVRGFWELVFITCLNFMLIGIAMRFTKSIAGKAQLYLKIVYVVFIAFNFIIMGSSHLRMQTYIDSYGHTMLRFLSHSFMLLLVVLNGVMLARVFFSRIKTVRLFIVAALLYFCTIAAVNPERQIARYNIARYEQTGKLDSGYLMSLSADSVIALCDFLEQNPAQLDGNLRKQAERKLNQFKQQKDTWQSANLSVMQAQQRLEQLLQ